MATILLISPESWYAHAVSKHHYATVLAKRGHKVLFLGPPEQRTDQQIEEVPVNNSLRIGLLRSPRVAPGIRFFPSGVRRMLERRWLERLERSIESRVDVVWLFENSRFFNMGFAGDRLKIYHQVDMNQRFHPAVAAQTASICFCTTDLIREVLLPHQSNVYVIHHGFQQPSQVVGLTSEQRAHFQQPGPHLVYAGNLKSIYLDVDLLAAIASAFPQGTLHLVGGGSPDSLVARKLAATPNVRWWGHLPSQALPAILAHADVLLVTYLESHWRDTASPHKFMEYLGIGKVVVSTYTHQYLDHRHLLAMADLGQNYLELLREVCANLSEWNSPRRCAERRAFALDHTYDRQLERIESLIRIVDSRNLLAAPARVQSQAS